MLAVLLIALPAGAEDPLNTVRAFCQADGRGARIAPRSWPDIADLVTWPLEPAWDHVHLIRGFELSTPEVVDGGVDVVVQYTITADVEANIVERDERVESRTYRLVRGDDGVWRIRAPAPPPYIFESDADPDALAALLDPASPSYLSNSAFAWHMLRDAGWAVAYADTTDLGGATDFTVERSAEVGDLALYYAGDQPYHVGIVESEDSVVSATLNGGIRRAPFGTFAGEIRYLRPVATVRSTPVAEPKPAAEKKPKRAKK